MLISAGRFFPKHDIYLRRKALLSSANFYKNMHLICKKIAIFAVGIGISCLEIWMIAKRESPNLQTRKPGLKLKSFQN
jgi:hypothetical protein